MRTAVEAKAYIHHIQKKCPYASDRRFLGGEWLYKSSVLHKSEPIPDKNYLSGKIRHHPSCLANEALLLVNLDVSQGELALLVGFEALSV